jgi:DNA-binding MarR family transcriptional regulator
MSGQPRETSDTLPDRALPDHALRWLESAQRRFVRDVLPLLSSEARDLGMRRIRILQLIPPAGIRQTDLAERAMVTKQALGPVVDGLEAAGWIDRTVDPADARAWIVTLGAKGQRVTKSFDDAIDAVERSLADEVGVADLKAFKRVLRAIGVEAEDVAATNNSKGT